MKRIFSMVMALALSITCLGFGASADSQTEFSDEEESQIIDCYFEQYQVTKDKSLAVLTPYYTDGTCYAFGIYVEYANAILTVQHIGDYTVVTGGGLEPMIYKDGVIYTLEDAYNANVVDANYIDAMTPGYEAASRLQIYLSCDTDRDGQVTVSDVVKLREMIMQGEDGLYYDVDGDGDITVSDVVALRAKIMEG